MQPEAAVHPARRHHAELHALRVREPERGHHPRVVRRHPEQLPRQPGVGRVSDQHDRQGEAERDAQELQRRQAEGAPLVDRPQREHEMDRERAVQQHGAERARPDLDREFERGFGGLERNEPERVVDEVGGDVGEEHEAGGEPQAPPHRAGGQVRNQSVAPRWRGARRRARSYTQSGGDGVHRGRNVWGALDERSASGAASAISLDRTRPLRRSLVHERGAGHDCW